MPRLAPRRKAALRPRRPRCQSARGRAEVGPGWEQLAACIPRDLGLFLAAGWRAGRPYSRRGGEASTWRRYSRSSSCRRCRQCTRAWSVRAAAPLSSHPPTTTNSSHVVGAGGAPSHHQGASQVPMESGSGVSTAHSRLPAPAPAASCVSPAGLSTRPRTALVAGSNAFAPATPESRRQPSAALAPVTAASAANASASSAAQQAARDAPVEASPSASSSSQQPQQQQQQQQLQQQGRVELRGKPARWSPHGALRLTARPLQVPCELRRPRLSWRRIAQLPGSRGVV